MRKIVNNEDMSFKEKNTDTSINDTREREDRSETKSPTQIESINQQPQNRYWNDDFRKPHVENETQSDTQERRNSHVPNHGWNKRIHNNNFNPHNNDRFKKRRWNTSTQ